MSCPCESDVTSSVERLQALIALETTLDDELDELERQYSLNLLKLDWLQKIGHEDMCHIVTKNNDKTESLLRMYRPMLQDACAEKMELIRSIMGSQGMRGDADLEGTDGDDDGHDNDHEMDDEEADHLPDNMSESGDDNDDDDDDVFGMRYT